MPTVARTDKAGGPLHVLDAPLPEPGSDEVRIRVHACGVCHSDSFTHDALWPGLQLPRIPGHEIAGVVDAIGEHVTTFSPGDRVGVGWFGGIDFTCDPCRRGSFINCVNLKVPGIAFDGGYAQYMIVQWAALARLPDALDFAEAAPLLCAGVTTYNALRHSGAVAGDLVAIQGLGGLGHLGVQFASRMGFRTVALARGKDKAAFAHELGAQEYIDGATENAAERLTAMGGARVILSTITNADAMSSTIGGLGIEGKFLVVGAPHEPLAVSALALIGGSKSVAGWASGTAMDSEDTLRFAAMTGVRPMIERFPLDRAEEAYQRMMSGNARFRVVIETN